MFVEELNQGNCQLLKLSRKNLQVSDSLFGTRKKYSFISKDVYFIKFNNKVQPLKRLNSSEITPALHLNSDEKKWIDVNKINFAKEQDVLTLFEYINTSRN
jgi:hypothetical protein